MISKRTTVRSVIYSLACFVALLILAVGIVPRSLHAQAGTADVLGTVTDQTGAVIPDAQVTLTNTGTGIVKKGTSNDRGDYLFTALQNGSYSLQIEMQGFKVYTHAGFAVGTGDRVRVDAKMEPGSVTEKVVVTTEAAALQTDSSTMTSTLDSTAVQDLPMEGRNYYSVLQNLPGVSGTGGGGRTGGGINSQYDSRPFSTVIANGQSDMQNDNLVNGFDNNEVAYGNTGVRPTVDGIQEMKVDTAIPQAEFGRAAGAVINIITKAGSNQFHGSLFEMLRNQMFDSHSYFDLKGTEKAPYHQNIFGGSIGGPVIKNKTFFFFGIEKDMINQAQSSGQLMVPTLNEYNNLQNGVVDFSDICVTWDDPQTKNQCLAFGTAVPTNTGTALDASPFFIKVFQLYPKPNASNQAFEDLNGFGLFVTNPVATQRLLDYEIRIDHHFTANDTLFARWGDNPVTSLNPAFFPAVNGVSGNGNAPSGGLNEWTKTKNMQIDYVHTVSQNLILDFKAGYTRYNTAAVGLNAGKGLAQAFGEPNAVAKGELGDDIPFIGGPPGLFPWQSIGGGNEQPYHNVENTFQYSSYATYIRGAHEVKFGGAMIRRQAFVDQTHTAAGFVLCGNGTTPYNTVQANCIAGFPTFIQRQTPVFNNIYRDHEWSIYVQDNWRMTSKLTLNLGVRYDIFTPWSDAHGYVSNFDALTLGDGLTPDAHNFILGGTGGVKTDYKALAPRIGFAYSLTPKTVIRGGFGITYLPFAATPAPGVTQMNGGAQNPPYYFNYQNTTPGLDLKIASNWPNPKPVNLADLNTNAALSGVVNSPSDTKDQKIYQTNLALQQQVGANTFTLAFVGVFDRDIPNQIDLNKPNMPGASGNGATLADCNSPTDPIDCSNIVPSYIYTNKNYSGSGSGNFGNTSSTAVFDHITSMGSWLFNGYSNYVGMQAIYDRQLSKGLSVDANWTYSHSLATLSGSTAQGSGNPNNSGIGSLFYSPSNTDLRHRVAITATYALPFGQSLHGVSAQIIKGWQLNSIFQWQAGSPLTLFASANCTNSTWDTADGSNPKIIDSRCPAIVVQNNPPFLPPGGSAGSGTAYTLQPGQTYYFPEVTGKWWSNDKHSVDLTKIHPAAPGTSGNPSSVTAFGPHFRTENLSLMKDFPIHDRLKLQFRAECFNLSNTPNAGSPALNIGGWNVGATPDLPNASADRGFGSVNTVVGNPRQLQFALRLQF
jgi:hypothetical protein